MEGKTRANITTVVMAKVVELLPTSAAQGSAKDGSMLVKLLVSTERVVVAEAWVSPGSFGLVHVTGAALRDELVGDTSVASSGDTDSTDEALADELKRLCLGGRTAAEREAEADSPVKRVARQRAYALLNIGPAEAASLWRLTPSDFSWW